MQRYRVVILIVLFGVMPVVISFFVALSYLKDEAAKPGAAAASSAQSEVAPPPPPPAEMRKVLAAARPFSIGTLIGDEDLSALEVELDAVRKGYILVDDEGPVNPLRGYAVREPIESGKAVMRSAIVGPGQRGFLAAVLGRGKRAVTIRVGPATSHAGLVDPGDRVDVILSAEIQATDRNRNVLARTIVEDVRVVAVDRRTGGGGGPVRGADDSPEEDREIERTEMITATLEVSPEQGDRLVLGEHEGKLSLAVRSLSAAPHRTANSAVELRDLLLSSKAADETDAVAREERLRQEVAMLEERLRSEEGRRLRLEEQERVRLEEEERARAAEEERLRLEREDRLQTAEEEQRRLETELALMEERLRSEPPADRPPAEQDTPPLRTVRVFRGSDPAREILFGEGR